MFEYMGDRLEKAIKNIRGMGRITEENISAYIDLANYTPGTYDVDIKIDSTDLRVSYVVASKVNIVIANS